MSHPADRHHRRLLNRKHKPYDGDRHLIRTMQAAMDDMFRRDREAVASEWDFRAFTVDGQTIAMHAGRYLASL